MRPFLHRLAAIALVLALVGLPHGGARANQGSYDVIRLHDGTGAQSLYRVWLTWPQLLLTTPDGGAWVFFTGQAGTIDSPYKLYVSRFDPIDARWTIASPVPGGDLQFGVAGAVDASGHAHVVYTDRAGDTDGVYGQVLYTHTQDDGNWTTPVAISERSDAGHQLAPSVVVDAYQVVHVVWQDQRYRTDGERAASPANADVLACEIGDDGRCMYEPDRLSLPSRQGEIGNRPQVTTDGERIIAVWSTYAGTTDEELASATRISWASRGLDFGPGWSAAQPAVLPEGTAIGGRLVDVASDPTGGVVLVYGRRTEYTRTFFTRLAAGSNAWDAPILLGDGVRGAFPSVAVGPDGTAYVVYNRGSAQAVTIAGQQIAPGATTAAQETELSTTQFGRKGQPVVDVAASGKVWVMYVFEPLLTGELDASQVPNEIRVERGVAFFTDPAPASQLVTPAAPGEIDASAPILSSPTRAATASPTRRPSATPTRTATASPTRRPSATPNPTSKPSATPPSRSTATALPGGSPYRLPSDDELENYLYERTPIGFFFTIDSPMVNRAVESSFQYPVIKDTSFERAWQMGGSISFTGTDGYGGPGVFAQGGAVFVDVFSTNDVASQVLSTFESLPDAERTNFDAASRYQEMITFSSIQDGTYVSWVVVRDRNIVVVVGVVAISTGESMTNMADNVALALIMNSNDPPI
jgi:hypothetical protein